MNFKKWVKSKKTAGYNGAHTVIRIIPKTNDKMGIVPALKLKICTDWKHFTVSDCKFVWYKSK